MIIYREIYPEERPLLDDFLYEAIFIPAGVTPPPKSIVKNEDLQVYVRDFGRLPDDKCLVVELAEKNGGRNQQFVIENSDLVRAKLISELKVK